MFSAELADEICNRLTEGESLRSICRSEGMPTIGTVMRWAAENAEFKEQYAMSREVQTETFADQIISIADGSGDGEDSAVLTARDRLRVDARKWIASKIMPKKYGDKTAHEHTGADGGAIVNQFILAPLK